MSTVTVESSRFGTLEIEAGAIIEFPAGLIGLGGRRYALVANDPESAFSGCTRSTTRRWRCP